jgi:hypothetical protein
MGRASRTSAGVAALAALACSGLCLNCSGGNPAPRLSDAAERGRTAFASYCIPCHDAANPHNRGLLGPPVARSSKELLEARVLRGEYPPGYEPKQTGNTMVKLPHVAQHLDDIAAFLAEVPDGTKP